MLAMTMASIIALAAITETRKEVLHRGLATAADLLAGLFRPKGAPLLIESVSETESQR